MDNQTHKPPPRPNGRWTNPATPLQAARFARKKSGKEVIAAIRQICPGHSGEPCRIDVSKLSDYECGNRRPGLEHIETFCRFYGRSPEELGLITWRDGTIPAMEAPASTNLVDREWNLNVDQEQLVLERLRDSAMTVATAVIEALAQCPVKIFAEPNGQETASDDDPPEEDPPTGTAVSG